MGLKWNAHVLRVNDESRAALMLSGLGADQAGVKVMTGRLVFRAIKIEKVPGALAREIKDAMVELNADAAISHDAYDGAPDETGVIMMATASQYRDLAREIRGVDPALDEFAAGLLVLLDRLERERFEVPLPKGKLALGEKPVIMGIVNCTPDSFYDGGRYFDRTAAVKRGRELLAAGADIIDVGGESTRPGADPVSKKDEIERVIPVVEQLASSGALVSIDTAKAEVAREAVKAGAQIINDVSSLADPMMASVAAETKAALVLMHMQGTPRTMQKDPRYADLFGEVIEYLSGRMDQAMAAGVSEEAIIVDPGIGFGKTVAHNLELIRDLSRLKSMGRPILLGPSNKSFLGKVLGVEPDDRSEGTAASLVAGVLAGAHILRVHDAAYHKRFVETAWAIRRGENWREKN